MTSTPAESLGAKIAPWHLCLLIAGLAMCLLPTYYDFAHTVWGRDDSGHGPIILGIAFWLMWREREAFWRLPAVGAPLTGVCVMALAMAVYVMGRSQGIDTVEGASHILALMACMLLVRGWAGVRLLWFPLAFLIFMVPVPGIVAQMLTLPLKSAVSFCAENILHALGFPMARSGVVLVVGPYQLLVADACSGLNSIFTLESLGLVYMKLMNYRSAMRNVILAIMILPISFIANTTRVISLVLVTYYFGDEFAQGIFHETAGLILFSVALVLIYGFDRILSVFFKEVPHGAK